MFADLFDNETMYELSGKIAKILEDHTISDGKDTGTKKSEEEKSMKK